MKFKVILVCTLILFGVAVNAVGGSRDKAEDHPGYVDFEMLDCFGDREAKIEVYLRANMLDLLAKFVETEDPELFEMINKLLLVRVLVFDMDFDRLDDCLADSRKTVKDLDRKGWERIVRVNEDDEVIYVYLKPSEEYESIHGILVIAFEDDESVFVNIVGEIHPDDVSRLGEHFDIDELDGVNYRKSHRRYRD